MESNKHGKNIPASEMEKKGFTYVAPDNRCPRFGKNAEIEQSEEMQEQTLDTADLTHRNAFLSSFAPKLSGLAYGFLSSRTSRWAEVRLGR